MARSVRTSMVTGYLGLPAEMANIHLRPPTHSASRASARIRITLLSGVLYPMPMHDLPAGSLDTHSLWLIIMIYAPTTNVTSLIRSSWLKPTRACYAKKLTSLPFQDSVLLKKKISLSFSIF